MDGEHGGRWKRVAILLALAAPVLSAQPPPPEAASKVRRILLYNFNGGWNCLSCREETQKVFFRMGQSRGFQVDTTSAVASLTPENMDRYQVIVWNNNQNGASSVPDTAAREAVSGFVRRGGGWMLVNLANDHSGTWRFLDSLVGPGTGGWRGQDLRAVLVADSAARRHPELRHLMAAMPDSISLRTVWLRGPASSQFDRYVSRTTTRYTPLFRLQDAAALHNTSGIPDYYVGAVQWHQGRALSIPLGWVGGFSSDSIMRQADSAVPKLYWQGLRWLAGDYAACPDTLAAGEAAGSRADAGPCHGTGIRDRDHRRRLPVEISGRRIRLASRPSGHSRVHVRDVQGRSVWVAALTGSATDFDLPRHLGTGLYQVAITGFDPPLDFRVLLP